MDNHTMIRNIMENNKRIKDINQAHIDAGNSTLRFGPSTVTFPPTRDLDPDEIREGMEKAIWEMTHCKCGENLPRHSYNYDKHQCYKCEQEEKDKKKSDWMNTQKELTIEERLVNMESWRYEMIHNPPRDPFNTLMR